MKNLLVHDHNRITQRVNIFFKVVLISSVLMVTGCSWVYKIDIPQGNYLNDKDIALIEVGMTKEQITYLLGAPMLFDNQKSNSWHYVYYYKPGNGKIIQKNLVVNFDSKEQVTDYKKDDVAIK